MQPVDHWVSKLESSRSGMSYSHQRFTFTVSRISSHVLLNVVLPFTLVTSLTGVSACLASADTRLQVITTIFMAAVGLRYVSVSYLPRVSYATFLDQFIWSCLLFVAAAGLVTMLSASVPWAAQPLQGARAPFATMDSAAWMALLFLWLAWNAWLLLCFADNLMGSRRWRNVPYLYTQRSSRESEEQELSCSHSLRKCHLRYLSPRLCCSRRSPLNCVACAELHLGRLRDARRRLNEAEEACFNAGGGGRAAAEGQRQEAAERETQADDAMAEGREGERIGSGRVLCREHLGSYYNGDMKKAGAQGWGAWCGSRGGRRAPPLEPVTVGWRWSSMGGSSS